jgi:hypothetical protein
MFKEVFKLGWVIHVQDMLLAKAVIVGAPRATQHYLNPLQQNSPLAAYLHLGTSYRNPFSRYPVGYSLQCRPEQVRPSWSMSSTGKGGICCCCGVQASDGLQR